MDILALRNLRDMTVMFFQVNKDGIKGDRLDKLSAITGVIDNEIFERGGEV